MKPITSVQIGNPIIRKKVRRVANVRSKNVKDTIALLTVSMAKNGLIGMAANQVGVDLQIFVTKIAKTKNRSTDEVGNLRVYTNPKITWQSKTQSILYEGCGSLANTGLFGPVNRPSEVTVEALDEHGKKFTLMAKGLLAKCIQHEYDHLQGIVCLDKFTDTRKVTDREYYLKNKNIK